MSFRNRCKWFVGLALLLVPALAFAVPATSSPVGNPFANLQMSNTSTGIFDNILADFGSAISGWYNPIYHVAVNTFTVLALIEITWLGATWLLSRKTFEDAIPSLVKKIITLGFFLALLLNSGVWIPDIINTFVDLGQNAGGVAHISPSQIVADGGAGFVNIVSGGATGIEQNAPGVWSILFHPGKAAVTGVNDMATLIIMFAVGIMFFFAMLFVAIEYLVVQIEAFIVISGGVIMLAGGGSRWTAKYVQPYLDYAISVGMRLMIITLFVGVVVTKVEGQIVQMLSQGSSNLFNAVAAMGAAIVLAMLAKKLPNIASSILSGSSSMTGQEMNSAIMKTAAVAGAGVVAASVVGAAGVTAGSAGGMGAGGAAGGGAAAGGMAPSASTASAAQGVAAPSTPPASGSAAAGVPSAAGVQAPKVSGGGTGGSSGPSASETRSTATAPSTSSGPVPAGGASAPTERTSSSSRGSGGDGSGTAAPTGATPPKSGNPGVQAGGSPKDPSAIDSGTPPPSTFQRAQDAAKNVYDGMNKAHEHFSPGGGSAVGVSAPGGGTKHLDD
ncbi:P-type conjugative transfer protein TrbL [Acidithiobacillus ferrivorans]|uniref:P-type conjugative transfer protein TrbL n=1 Tax=Acidithiobacillus ferrivorans TaxID=160808 RepID=A0A7T4WCJ7_9PROT|nr:P-type conjugative transfer protein TrbL [Acidithiobacillus ferrivorans]QQD71962.1 P-type conjugative transfer protein TrbL [Acidithiobacillus ferrivorans]